MLNEVKHLDLACEEKQIPRFARNEVIFIDEQNVRHPEPVEGCEIALTVNTASFDGAQDGRGCCLYFI